MSNPYDILGVPTDADDETVRNAYRERVKEVHPDKGGSQEAFIRVRDAYLAIINDEVAEHGGNENQSRDSRPWETHRNTTRGHRRSGVQATVEYLDYTAVRRHGWSLGDDALFKKAREATLSSDEHGTFTVEAGETVLAAAERNGHDWPYSCRGGACANCAVRVIDGNVRTPEHAILSKTLLRQNFRLSCIGEPLTRTVRLVFNVKDLDELGDMLLPPQ